jgi:CheY-like chemotaxis protein
MSAPDVPKRVYLVFVEDDHDDQQLIRETFTRFTFDQHILIFNNGDALIDYLSSLKQPELFPYLIVLDYNLPRLSGEAILMLIKKDRQFRRIPVSIFSTTLSPDKEKALLVYGATSCRKKPTTIDAFQYLMSEYLQFVREAAAQQSIVL